MTIISVTVSLLLALAPGAWQQNEQPRPPSTNAQGLLRINQEYFDLAASTGGDFYYWAAGEFSTAALSVPIGGDDVVLAYGALDGSRIIEIPVESGARQLTVFCGAQRKDVAQLLRPDGTVARNGDAGVKLQSYQHMIIAEITTPAAGVWKLALTGSGQVTVTARVKPPNDAAAPDFGSFEFVEVGGRPGHEGWFPIKRGVKKGEIVDCTASLSGTVSAVEFAFVAKDGEVIARVLMTPEGAHGDYHGRCTIPSVPFRARVTGLDASGAPFQRIESGLRIVAEPGLLAEVSLPYAR